MYWPLFPRQKLQRVAETCGEEIAQFSEATCNAKMCFAPVTPSEHSYSRFCEGEHVEAGASHLMGAAFGIYNVIGYGKVAGDGGLMM